MEWYSSTHSESVDGLLKWPWRRFERFYEAARKRVLVEDLQARKEGMIAALWANSNYDSQEKGQDPPRTAFIQEIEENYAHVIDVILNGAQEEEEGVDDPYGFFAAGKRGESKTYKVLDEGKDTTVQDVIDYERDIDQR